MELEAFDPLETYVQLEDGPRALPRRGGDAFWAEIGARADLQSGRLVCASRASQDWESWEMHPEGDEIVFLLSGAVDLVIEQEGGERRVALRGRSACIVPRGCWHRAVVHEAAELLHVTRGAGTRHRPL